MFRLPILAIAAVLSTRGALAAPPDAVYRLTTGAGSELRIPLERRGAPADLARAAAIVFSVRGAQGGEDFEIGLESGADTHWVGSIYTLLPLGPTGEWQQVGLAPATFSAPPPASAAALKLRWRREGGTALVRGVRVVPVLAGTSGWDRVVAPLEGFAEAVPAEARLQLSYYHQEGKAGWWGAPAFSIEKPERAPASAPPKPVPTPPAGGLQLVSDFDAGVTGALGGTYAPFQRAPSEIALRLEAGVHHGGGGRALAVQYRRAAGGYCGLWMHLYDDTRPAGELRYFNAANYRYLSFWIKGERGGENVDVHLADWSWQLREDSVPIARVSALLPGGVTTEWQEVRIPLDPAKLPSLDLSLLATLVWQFSQPGEGKIFIDDVVFKVARDEQPVARPAPRTTPQVARSRATWVWSPTAPLRDPDERAALFAFAEAQRIGVVFLQLHYELANGVCRLEEAERLRALIREAHARRIKVRALDGDKHFALRPWHRDVQAVIRAVIEYNRAAAPEECFDGIHHDIEPYLLPGFAGATRSAILGQYLDLVAACRALVRESGQALTYGVDIPFWYENALGAFPWRGSAKPVSHHLIDLTDYVSVMDYRTSAIGADGTIAHALDEVAYARRQGKQVLIGLETGPLPDESIHVFHPEPRIGSQPLDPHKRYLALERFGDVGILYLSPLAADGARPLRLPKALARRGRLFASQGAIEVPAGKLTFAGRGTRELESVIEQTLTFFGGDVAGIAVHHYGSYRDLVKPR